MEEYKGKKFRPTGNKIVVGHDWWGNKIVKDEFRPTWGYMKWLDEKREKEKQKEIMIWRHKLEAQMKEYGEVDQIDLDYFISLCK